MSRLDQAQQLVADHLRAHMDADPIRAAAPAAPVAGGVYVWPADPWVVEPDDGSFCEELSVGLVVDIVAAVIDLVHSQSWIADRVAEVFSAGAVAVDVDSGETTRPIEVARPFLIGAASGELLVVRVEYARFNLKEA